MDRRIFGWDLPPSCTVGDIERAFGGEPTMLECFEFSEKEKLSEDDKKVLADLFEYDCNCDLIQRILEWAHKQGYQGCREDESMHWDWMIGEMVVIPNPHHNPRTHQIFEDGKNQVIKFLEKQRGGFNETKKCEESVSSEADGAEVSS